MSLFASEPGAVDFSYVTYFLVFWHIKAVRLSSLKSIIKRMLLWFPLLPWKQLTSGRLWEAGCHGDGYGDLHKYSSGVGLGPHDKFSQRESDGVETMSLRRGWGHSCAAHVTVSKVRIVSLVIKRRLSVEQMPSSPKVTFAITQSFYPSRSLDE